MQSSPFGPEKDSWYMAQALAQAHKAEAIEEVPIGALVVDVQGTIIGRGFNQVEKRHTQAAHAEIIAIMHAGKKLKDWRLKGCWLYVTLEPCALCMALIRLSRLQGIIYGASSPLFGYRLDNNIDLSVYNKDLLVTISGVMADEAGALLKQFFKTKRKKGE
jgi:tRNA(adenine34) deaminase